MTREVFLLVTVVIVITDGHSSDDIEPAQPVGSPRFCSAEGQHCFSYNELSPLSPRNWFKVCRTAECAFGFNQSPILIDPETVEVRCDENLLGYDKDPEISGLVHNEGTYPSVGPIVAAHLSGVPGFPETNFSLVSVHIHFRGGPNGIGTEHQVGEADYDAEMHLVHVRQDVSILEANSVQSGLAVVGVFLSTKEGEPSTELDSLIHQFGAIKEYRFLRCRNIFPVSPSSVYGTQLGSQTCPKNNEHCIDSPCPEVKIDFHPDGLLPDQRDFYSYYGSLTTPPLSEVVAWNVMAQPIRITHHQLQLMQRLESQENAVKIVKYGNVRPHQPLNGRKVFFNSCQ